MIEFFHSPEVEDDTIGENDRNEFLKSIEIEKVNVKSNIRKQQTNSEEYFASLFPNALLDGSIVVYESSHIECIGSRGLRYI